jgi:hypothetical protein
MQAGYVGMAILQDLRHHIPTFLALYGVVCLGYGVAVWWSLRGPRRRSALLLILGLALLFRVTLLFTTPPTLSDDVYRYIWDGRLMNAGINPYAHAVESPLLDPFNSPLRALVNHGWMATPYLPAAQAFFATIYRLIPDSPLAFQLAAILLDLLTGGLVADLLRRCGLPRRGVLVYLWNPLVVVEFAHGAHVDALMICLMMAALWFLVAARSGLASAIALSAATLTKGLPVLLLPVVARRWGWRYTAAYTGLAVAICSLFASGAGWGLMGPLDGEGLFGALRIYTSYWNYNSGLYHWLEVLLSGHPTPGAVPIEIVGWQSILAAKLIVAVALLGTLAAVWHRSRRLENDLTLLRLAVVPLVAYLLLATTIHPWYVTLIIPLLPFLPSLEKETSRTDRFLPPLLWLSAAVSLSYLTYRDLTNLREYDSVRVVEYVPTYLLLIWATWSSIRTALPANGIADGPGTD